MNWNPLSWFKRKDHECYGGRILDVYDDATLKIRCCRCNNIFTRKSSHYCGSNQVGAAEIRKKLQIIKDVPWQRRRWYRIDGLTDIINDHSEQEKIENGLWKIRLLEPHEPDEEIDWY